MKHAAIRAAGLAVVLAVAAAHLHSWEAWAVVDPRGPRQEQELFSPLFARRLEVGKQNMDKPADRVSMAGLRMVDPVGSPLSANPVSTCLASGCFGSACLGSACLLSACIGSACANSKCVGSGCVVSICAGSACVTSGCVGSVCTGSACVGSVCVATACVGSSCTRCLSEDPSGLGTRG